MDKIFGEEKQMLTLYRGVALESSAKLLELSTLDKLARFIFSERFPPLCSNVAQRFNPAEAYKRYRALRTSEDSDGMKTAMNDHFKGARDYSFLLSASEEEAHAVFFAATTWKNNEYGAVVRFSRNHDYEVYSPTDYIHPYKEVLVASCIEPREIDKVYIIGCKSANHLRVEAIFKRGEDGHIQRFHSPAPTEYFYLKNIIWTAESFFNPPIESVQNK